MVVTEKCGSYVADLFPAVKLTVVIVGGARPFAEVAFYAVF